MSTSDSRTVIDSITTWAIEILGSLDSISVASIIVSLTMSDGTSAPFNKMTTQLERISLAMLYIPAAILQGITTLVIEMRATSQYQTRSI